MQMSGIFQFAVRMHTETEAKMTSIERINHYITVGVPSLHKKQQNYAGNRTRTRLVLWTIDTSSRLAT